mgnify:CR=1 FL=1
MDLSLRFRRFLSSFLPLSHLSITLPPHVLLPSEFPTATLVLIATANGSYFLSVRKCKMVQPVFAEVSTFEEFLEDDDTSLFNEAFDLEFNCLST